jgi:periplasmic divalent cation tolerance protein
MGSNHEDLEHCLVQQSRSRSKIIKHVLGRASMQQETILVLTNVPDNAVAKTLAEAMVEQRLAACVNILPVVQSVYRWQGVIEQASEITLMIKTTRARYAELEQLIQHLHPYDVPEVIAIPVSAGLPSYLQWIESETSKEMNA